MANNTPSLILLYTGNGKGKTSAAMGQMFRALGHNARCAVAQFIKQDPEKLGCGEYRIAQSLGVAWAQFGAGFTWEGENDRINAELAKEGWLQVKQWIMDGVFDLIVLDEFTYTLNLGYLDCEEICTWLSEHKSKKGFPHLVITGRNAPQSLIMLSDMVSDLQEIKHHLSSVGRDAEPMIEY